MSRAVVFCSRSGRPEALRNTVSFMPSRRACRVIVSAKASSLPPSASATTLATSLADRTMMAWIAVSTVRLSPGESPRLVAGMLAA